MTQTRAMSLVEAVINVVVGFLVALGTQLVVFPVVGLSVTFERHMLIGLVFTGVSLLRSYLLRRLFNRIGTGGFDADRGAA